MMKKKLLLAGLIIVGIICIVQGQAFAAVNQLPNPDDDSTDNPSSGYHPSDIAVVVSNANASRNNRLDAPISYIKVFIPEGQTGNIVIQNGAQCGSNAATTAKSIDWLFQNGFFGETVQFDVFRTVAGSDGYGGTTEIQSGAAIATRYDSQMNCGNYSIPITASAAAGSTVPGHENYVVFIIRARGIYPGSGNLNGFRLTTSGLTGAYYSYFSRSGNKFALLERDGFKNTPSERNNYILRFAPSCNITNASTSVRLNWFDDDYGTSYQPTANYYTVLNEFNASTNALTGTRVIIPNRGEGVAGDATITVRRGYKYEWIWIGVTENNGIQFQLPFDSFNYYQDCTKYNMTTAMSVIGDTLVAPGDERTLQVRVRNSGQDNSAYLCGANGLNGGCVFVRQSDPSGILDLPPRPAGDAGCATPSGAEPPMTVISTYGVGRTFCNSTTHPDGPGGNFYHWRFSYNSIPGNAISYGGTFNVRIRPGAPQGANACFRAYLFRPSPLSATSVASNLVCLTVADAERPYSRVYGGDVSVGFQGPCQAWVESSADGITNAGIIAANRGPGNYEGSGAQYAVQAAGVIDGFASAFLRAERPNGLSFANNEPGDVGYGGNFGSSPCPADYFGQRDTSLPAMGGGPVFAFPGSFPDADTSTNANVDTFYINGGGAVTRLTGGTLPNGRHIVIYVDGDLQIESDILFNLSSWGTVLNRIPSLTVIVKGNIYVQQGVSVLNGIYVAQPTAEVDEVNPAATKGYFYTCASGTNPPGSAAAGTSFFSSTTNGCARQKLTVNGSVVALGLKLYRANGDLDAATNNEAAGSSNIAEEFQYTSEFWLQPCNTPQCLSGSSAGYTALPPVL